MLNMIKMTGVLLMIALLSACGGGDGFSGGTTPEPDPTEQPPSDTNSAVTAAISLATSQISIKSDNSDSATVTATVLDANNAVVPGVNVAFKASGGQLTASAVKTDDAGKAMVLLSSGSSDPSNRIATVTATVTGIAPAQIPVKISGSTITITASKTSLIPVTAPNATLTLTAKNASGQGVYNAPLTLSVAGVGATPGVATLSAATGNTDVSGVLSATITGTSPGTVRLTVSGLGYTATQDFTVVSVASAFQITAPTSSPASASIGSNLTVTVSAPNSSSVRFVTTLGVWDGSANSMVVKPVSGGVASAVLSSAVNGGVANVQVLDANNSTIQDSIAVLISAPASTASEITLQSDVGVLAPSSGGLVNQAILTATVKNASLQPVANAAVIFSISSATGGGESLSIAYGLTDSAGEIKSTFTSGNLASTQSGVVVTATVVDAAGVMIDSADKSIVIGGAAGSVVVGGGTEVAALDPATYSYPMSVLVADTNGNAISGAVVTLSVWPAYYAGGYWVDTDPDPSPDAVICGVARFGASLNEDINENLTLDMGEDLGPNEDLNSNGSLDIPTDLNGDGDYVDAGENPGVAYVDNGITIRISEDLDGDAAPDFVLPDGQLTPGNSAGGAAPRTLVTDSNGVATFSLVYLKAHASWIKTRIRASVEVFGTETTGTINFWLPAQREEAESCLLPDSPFNPAGL